MSAFSRFTPLITRLPATVPFVGPEAIERKQGLAVKARIGANESGFGPSPKALAALTQASSGIWAYADPENHDLKQALAHHYGLRPDNFAIGEGIDDLLGLTVRLVIEQDMPVVTALGSYPTFHFHVTGFGGRLVTMPYVNDREDLDALLSAVKKENAPLVYLANPDNPMGSWHDGDDIVAFARSLPQSCLLILDEAYGETAPTSAIPPLETLIDLPNVVRMRTFSKAYGLAGARVGYAIGTAGTVSAFDKIRNHFGMVRTSVAAALAALDDQDYLAETVTRIAAARERIAAIALKNGLTPLPSATNFVAIDTHGDGGRARAIVDGLMQHGVFIRMPGVAPLNRCIRVSAGLPDDLDLFAEALPKVLAGL
ncbi:pyridoxal phosphate-dependent aminotransferase [Allorhizobium sp. BGMRC 0089]|uniref:pyridoxal phosphate-dependent aminotransferase n=1 Tax=Allorhizobium sonneratiae TaxID=2934936 RepID=UPI002033E294|nr:pyridoxal phosphate-dependent aminotransferase [Allorhizobium sonneratiae]MCM2291963.1 pyridoxal phosphate-dependent aminotransferase [Allorhizobium sonneratiae]